MKNKEIENGLEGIGLLENEMGKLEAKVNELVVNIVQRDFPEVRNYRIHCPFIYECEKSPFGWCVYIKDKNTISKKCLYCNKTYQSEL